MGILAILGLPPRVVLALALTAMVGAVGYTAWFVLGMWAPPRPEPGVPMAYYFDQNTRQLIEGPQVLKAPFETSSGPFQGMPAAVLAHVVSCGKCWDPEQRVVGWLEAPADALLAAGVTLPPAPHGPEGTCEIVIRRVDDSRWVYLTSREGIKIVEGVQSTCSGDVAVHICQPADRSLSEIDPAYQAAVVTARQKDKDEQALVERERPLELEKEKALWRESEELIRSGAVKPDADGDSESRAK